MHDDTRRSWNVATRNHNAHKGDQAARFREGLDVLFDEEIELLGDLEGKQLVHLQCNAAQDSICLARRGAAVTGVDFSDEAIAFGRALSKDSGIAIELVEAEVLSWLHQTDQRFDVAFSSYGAAVWLHDLDHWARGIRRVLKPGGRFVYVEFHPVLWSFGPDLKPTADDYFTKTPFITPVGDYVADAGAALAAVDSDAPAATTTNTIPAASWQHGLGEIIDAFATNGFIVEHVREYPHANGAKVHSALVPSSNRRWVWPEGVARTPLMFGLSVRSSAEH